MCVLLLNYKHKTHKCKFYFEMKMKKNTHTYPGSRCCGRHLHHDSSFCHGIWQQQHHHHHHRRLAVASCIGGISMHTDSSLRAVRDNFETGRGWHDAVESAAYSFCANRHTAELRWIADAWHPHSHDTNSSGICTSLAHTAAVYAPRCMRMVGCSSRRKHSEHNLVVRN